MVDNNMHIMYNDFVTMFLDVPMRYEGGDSTNSFLVA